MSLYGKLVGREVVETDDMHETFARDVSVQVGNDMVGPAQVSTVFLRLDHGFGGTPLWFETMIFGGDHDGWHDRYHTYDEAETGHKRVVEALKAGHSPDHP